MSFLLALSSRRSRQRGNRFMSESILIDEAETLPTRRRLARTGIAFSLFVHGSAMTALVVAPLFWLMDSPSFDKNAITIVSVVSQDQDQDQSKPDEVRIVTDPDEVKGGMVEEKINQAIEDAKKHSTAENLGKLDKLTEKLNDVSSEKSIDQLTTTFDKWFGNDKRAFEPAREPVKGPFDYDTAQVHSMRREPGQNGGWIYFALMVDADGRTMETEMRGPEAETLYTTLERIKAFPLAEKVYRQMALPLIDKLIRAQENASRKNDKPKTIESNPAASEPYSTETKAISTPVPDSAREAVAP